MTLVAEAAMTGLLGLWMITGAYDNWRFPDLNRNVVAEVMRLERMKDQYPEDFARIAHRRVESDTFIRLAFRIIVLWETLAAILLSVGTILLFAAAATGSEPTFAKEVALAGAVAFTANWAGFLIGGNYFCYYYCHFEGQFTHFLLVIWGGIVVSLLL